MNDDDGNDYGDGPDGPDGDDEYGEEADGEYDGDDEYYDDEDDDDPDGDDEYGDDEYGDDEYYDEDGLSPLVRTVGLALGGVLILAVIGWFFVRPALTGDEQDDDAVVVDQALADGTTAPATTERASSPTTEAEVAVASDPPPTEAPPETDPVDDTDTVETTEADDTEDDEPSRVTTTQAPVETEPATTTEAPAETAPTTTEAAVQAGQTPGTPAASPGGGVTYDTLPDGSPAPVVAVFGADRVTLTGAVPSQQAKDRLQALALANAKPGQGDTIVDFVTINPDVPIGVGVRVIELTSERFPELSAEILPAHAAELDRVVAVMNALPNVTALVIGHADQRGNALRNYAISDSRADAVVLYLASKGIAAERLASRAVGSSDLLTLDSDEVALALNRRTEFVFYGLLVE